MQMDYLGGTYTGEVKNNLPNGTGVLVLLNGIKKGKWKNGKLAKGATYVDDVVYVGEFDEEENYHGNGYLNKENVFEFWGRWEHGEIVSNAKGKLPNCVFIGMYYGGIEPTCVCDEYLPRDGKMHRSGYTNLVTADHYEMPLLSQAFGKRIVCVVERHNNRYDYSKGYNQRALFFCEKNKSMYTDAWVFEYDGEKYLPLEPKTAIEINYFIHEALAYEDIEDFGEVKKDFELRKFVNLTNGIYKGQIDENGNMTGNGWLVYNHDDAEGRLLYKGALEGGVPNGYGDLYYQFDAENAHYRGNFCNGLFHTKGTHWSDKGSLKKSNGADWYGYWVNGEFEGEDNGVALDGWAYETFKGRFEKSQIIEGEHYNPNDPRGKYKYVGPFRNWKPHGKGTEEIEGITWTGYFDNGRRIVGQGANAVSNSVELIDPGFVASVSFEDFDERVLAIQLMTKSVALFEGGYIQELSKAVKQPLVLVYANNDGVATSKTAKDLFDIDATGSYLICGMKNGTVAPIGEKALSKLKQLLATKLASLQDQSQDAEYTLCLLDEKHTSDWDVTRETHDDYPLEADHDFANTYFYRLEIGDSCYYAIYYVFASYEWEAGSDDENFSYAYATLKLHKIPSNLTNHEDIKSYCDTQIKWSKTWECDTVRSQDTYRELCNNGGFLPPLLQKVFGKRLTQKA